MKKLLIILVLLPVTCLAQNSRWFISFSTGGNIGGPAFSLKNKMNQQGFNQSSQYNFFGFTGTTQYPVKSINPYALLCFGKKISDRRSIFFVTGIADKGEVTGFKNTGYSDFLGILGSSDGPMPSVSYSLLQFTGGYMYSSSKTRAKVGFGPSLFLLNYSMNEEGNKNSLVPGAFFTGRFPAGREKKLFGVELVLDVRVAPPARIRQDDKTAEGSFHAGKVNMISASAGIAFCFRK